MHGDARDGPARPPRGRGRGDEREAHARGDDPPGHVGAVEPVPGRPLERGSRHEPGHAGERGAEQRGDRADDEAVGQHHEPEVTFGRADGGEHPELAQAPLGDHHEAGRGHEADEDRDDHREAERADGGDGALVVTAVVHHADRGGQLSPKTVLGGPHQHGQFVRTQRSGRDERELVVDVGWVLDDAHHRPVDAVEVDVVAHAHPEGGRGAVGDRDLVTSGIAPGPHAEQRAGVAPVGILAAVLDGVDRTRHGHPPVADHVDRPEPGAELAEGGRELASSPRSRARACGSRSRSHGPGRVRGSGPRRSRRSTRRP